MLTPLLRHIEMFWWDLVIQTLSRFTLLQHILRVIYRHWPRSLRAKDVKILLITAISGFVAGMLLAELSWH
ncbi:hypothetical protein [uncultured Thermanaerothrix sp.]|uniref:hypothetical protein n=1 Tax=uncultured Thermanaerothrix sp. TaxID=1195149 RepID=UPI00261C3DDC|nr:hypothetical protein [uncultured Thermanaerothrix sp.]